MSEGRLLRGLEADDRRSHIDRVNPSLGSSAALNNKDQENSMSDGQISALRADVDSALKRIQALETGALHEKVAELEQLLHELRETINAMNTPAAPPPETPDAAVAPV